MIQQQVVHTEGIKYAGSKLKLLPYIIELLADLKDVRTMLDGFSGTTRVAQAFARLGYTTTANDISCWSEVLATCYLKADKPDAYYRGLIDHLNGLKGYDGWFTEHYGGVPESMEVKRPFQVKNTRRLDAIRDEIDRLQLDAVDKSVALTSLIRALDVVDNTLGHYAAYLSGWSGRSHKELELKVPAFVAHDKQHRVCRGDVFDTIRDSSFDFAYFDPPYGSNNAKMPPSRIRYNAYYHLWKTVILNDRPTLFGKAMRRDDSRDSAGGSVFEDYRTDSDGMPVAHNALKRLLSETNARYILLSYSSGGKVLKDDILSLISGSGHLLRAVEVDHKRNVMSGMTRTNKWTKREPRHREYLFLMQK